MYNIFYFIYLLYLYYTVSIELNDKIKTPIIDFLKYSLFDIIKYSILFLIILYIGYFNNFITDDNIIIKNINEIDCILSILIYFYMDKIWTDYNLFCVEQNKCNNDYYIKNKYNFYFIYYLTILNIFCKIIQ